MALTETIRGQGLDSRVALIFRGTLKIIKKCVRLIIESADVLLRRKHGNSFVGAHKKISFPLNTKRASIKLSSL